MGLAASQAMLLTLTARKADCEYGIAINSMHKMSLTRQMSELSQEYQTKLNSKSLSFYANGQYGKLNYQYLMGYGNNYTAIWGSDGHALKKNNSMVLTDYKGQVVLSADYANAIMSVLGPSAMDGLGRGSTFSTDNIASILNVLVPGVTTSEFQAVISEKTLNEYYNSETSNTLSGNLTGETDVVDNSDAYTAKIKALVDFYYPILVSAATNGWTTEYNDSINSNDDYISDAIISGTFNLVATDINGNYNAGTDYNYFVTTGDLAKASNADDRAEITAWYEAEKDYIAEQESLCSLELTDLSTELEAIKVEIETIKQFIDDATGSVFNWGGQ